MKEDLSEFFHYEEDGGVDYYAELLRMAYLIKERKFDEINADLVADALYSVLREQEHSIVNWLGRVMTAKLFYDNFDSVTRHVDDLPYTKQDCLNTYVELGDRIFCYLERTPFLKERVLQKFDWCYELSVSEASRYFEKGQLPQKCPWKFEELCYDVTLEDED